MITNAQRNSLFEDLDSMLDDQGWQPSGLTERSKGSWSIEVRVLDSGSFYADTFHDTAPARCVATIICPSLEVFKQALPGYTE